MREAIESLSALNFKSHINSVRLINMIRNVPDDARAQKERVETILEEIAALTNFVLTL
jgi:hypothetical protein